MGVMARKEYVIFSKTSKSEPPYQMQFRRGGGEVFSLCMGHN